MLAGDLDVYIVSRNVVREWIYNEATPRRGGADADKLGMVTCRFEIPVIPPTQLNLRLYLF
jgi:hypothetical protein